MKINRNRNIVYCSLVFVMLHLSSYVYHDSLSEVAPVTR